MLSYFTFLYCFPAVIAFGVQLYSHFLFSSIFTTPKLPVTFSIHLSVQIVSKVIDCTHKGQHNLGQSSTNLALEKSTTLLFPVQVMVSHAQTH